MLQSRKGRDLACSMPKDRILTETDGPFARCRSGPLKPWDVVEAEEILAELWGVSPPKVRSQLLANLDRLVASG